MQNKYLNEAPEVAADRQTLDDAGLRITEVPGSSIPSHIMGIPLIQGELGDVIDKVNQRLQVLMGLLHRNERGEAIVAEIAELLRAHYRATKLPAAPSFDKCSSEKFDAVKTSVVMGGEVVGRMKSHTLARRTARALNAHTPNERGV